MDAEQPLDAALNPRLDSGFFQLVANDLLHLDQECLTLLAPGVDRFFHLLIADRIEKAEAEILQFTSDLTHAQTVGDGRENFQSLLCDLLLAVRLEVLQSPHIVQPVGQFDEHHPNVVDHGQHHLAEVLRLLLLASGKVDLADLGDALHDVRDLFAELLADVNDRHGRVHRDRIHLHFGKHQRNFQRMDEIRLTRRPALPFMNLQRVVVGFLDERQIILRTVLLHALHQLAELSERERGRLDLLAQSRHVGL